MGKYGTPKKSYIDYNSKNGLSKVKYMIFSKIKQNFKKIKNILDHIREIYRVIIHI